MTISFESPGGTAVEVKMLERINAELAILEEQNISLEVILQHLVESKFELEKVIAVLENKKQKLEKA